MKTLARTFAVASITLLVWACGGAKAFTDGDAGHHDEGGTGDAGTCPPRAGCSSTTECRDECSTCSCVDGTWACAEFACLDASLACPATPPASGSFCQENGRSCTFGPGCGPQCTCENNAWKCVVTPCPPSQCPPIPPQGRCDDRVGLSCSWGSGCTEQFCDCVATSAGGIWECGSGACGDSGSR